MKNLTLLTLLLSLHSVQAAPPFNDSHDNSTTIFFPGASGTNIEATLQANEARPIANLNATIWYRYRGGYSGWLVIDTAGSNFDTILAAYPGTGENPAGFPPLLALPQLGATPLAFNDDSGLIGGPSRITFPVQGQRSLGGGEMCYLIQVGGFNAATGIAQLNPSWGPPPSDDFVNRTAMGEYAFWKFQNTPLTLEVGEYIPDPAMQATAWFTWTAFYDGSLRVITAPSITNTVDTVVAAYQQPTPNRPLAADLIAWQNGSQDVSEVEFPVVKGRTYALQVGAGNASRGVVELSLVYTPAAPIVARVAQATDTALLPGGVTNPRYELLPATTPAFGQFSGAWQPRMGFAAGHKYSLLLRVSNAAGTLTGLSAAFGTYLIPGAVLPFGDQFADFVVSSPFSSGSIPPAGEDFIEVTFTPGGVGTRSAALLMAHNGLGLQTVFLVECKVFDETLDSDADGLTELVEYNLRSFGSSFEVGSTPFKNTLATGGYFTASQYRSQFPGASFLQRDSFDGSVPIQLGLQRSTDLISFVPRPMSFADFIPTPGLTILFPFSDPGPTLAFFKLSAQ